MRKSIKKIAATLLAATMALGTMTTAFGFTVEEGKITDLDEGESIYLLAGNATGWESGLTNPDSVFTASEANEAIVEFNVTLQPSSEGEWTRRFSIIGNYYDGENYVQGGWTRLLLGEPAYKANDTYSCLSVICVDDLEEAVDATLIYDTRTATLLIVDAEGNKIDYTVLWASNDREDAKADGSAYTLDELAEIGYDDFVASLSADRQGDIAAIAEALGDSFTKSLFDGKYLENYAGLYNYFQTGEDYFVEEETTTVGEEETTTVAAAETTTVAAAETTTAAAETTVAAAQTTTTANTATKTGDVAPVALLVVLVAAVAVVTVAAKKKEA